MDAYEQMAADLESKQHQRIASSKSSSTDFWNDRERLIYKQIQIFRAMSDTFYTTPF